MLTNTLTLWRPVNVKLAKKVMLPARQRSSRATRFKFARNHMLELALKGYISRIPRANPSAKDWKDSYGGTSKKGTSNQAWDSSWNNTATPYQEPQVTVSNEHAVNQRHGVIAVRPQIHGICRDHGGLATQFTSDAVTQHRKAPAAQMNSKADTPRRDAPAAQNGSPKVAEVSVRLDIRKKYSHGQENDIAAKVHRILYKAEGKRLAAIKRTPRPKRARFQRKDDYLVPCPSSSTFDLPELFHTERRGGSGHVAWLKLKLRDWTGEDLEKFKSAVRASRSVDLVP